VTVLGLGFGRGFLGLGYWSWVLGFCYWQGSWSILRCSTTGGVGLVLGGGLSSLALGLVLGSL
jgi:hypothetical protein